MSIALLDVNVLMSLLDPEHPHHEDAHRWFSLHRNRGWATCPLTINGCVRVLSNPAYPTTKSTPAEALSLLRVMCSTSDHHSWNDSVSLLDPEIFRPHWITGPKQITAIYLLGLAVRHHGKLATFDRSIPVNTVIGAGPRSLELLPVR
jgi:hypothetical protein